jgi:AcrR family transcriptional regulator
MRQRDVQRLETRAALAEHALRLFNEKGYDETTVEEIAAAAGVSPRTFFLHFPTKAAAAFPDHAERVAAFRQLLGKGDEYRDPIGHLCECLLEGENQSPPSRRVRYRLLAKVPALRDEDARTDRDYEAVIARFLMEKWGTSVEARVRANAVANAVLGVARAALIAAAEDGIDPRATSLEILHRMFGSPFDFPLRSLQ